MSSRRRVFNNLPQAMKAIREQRGLTQEDFGVVSSRTYVSGLERGQKSPTLGKLEELATVMSVHPLTLLALAYSDAPSPKSVTSMWAVVQEEVTRLWSEGAKGAE